MRRDQTRAPEPMRSTLPNTDQPRIPHSEYHYNICCRTRFFSPQPCCSMLSLDYHKGFSAAVKAGCCALPYGAVVCLPYLDICRDVWSCVILCRIVPCHPVPHCDVPSFLQTMCGPAQSCAALCRAILCRIVMCLLFYNQQ